MRIAQTDVGETGEAMNGRVLENRRWSNEQSTEVLDVLSQSDTPALATEVGGDPVVRKRAAEGLRGGPAGRAPRPIFAAPLTVRCAGVAGSCL